jgi:hypothetical protein
MATRAPKLQTVEGALNEPLTVNHPNLAAAMTAAFAEIEGATKAATNPHFKSKYADLTSIIEAIKPALIKHGLFFTQRCQPSEDGVSVETVLHHSSGEKEPLGILYVPANKRDAQGFGSALTYARRYALQTAFGVPTEDDDGNAASVPARAANNGHQARANEARDAPFPQGPCKNKTELKDKGRALWADVMACEDKDTLDALLASHKALIDQLKEGLPQWWGGGMRDGEPYEGLGQVIERLQRDFDGIMNTGTDWRGNVLHAG